MNPVLTLTLYHLFFYFSPCVYCVKPICIRRFPSQEEPLLSLNSQRTICRYKPIHKNAVLFLFYHECLQCILAIISSSLDPGPAPWRMLSQQELMTSLLSKPLIQLSLSQGISLLPHSSIQCCGLCAPFSKRALIQGNHGVSSLTVGHVSVPISGLCLSLEDANYLLPAVLLLRLFCLLLPPQILEQCLPLVGAQ